MPDDKTGTITGLTFRLAVTDSQSKKLYQFDKDEKTVNRTSSKNVAVHRGYYTSECFSESESSQAPSVSELIRKGNFYGLDTRAQKGIRDFVWQLYIRTNQARIDLGTIVNNLNECFGTEMPSGHEQVHSPMVRESQATRGRKFEHVHFTILNNRTDIPFWTSDNPVANCAVEIHMPNPKTCSGCTWPKNVRRKRRSLFRQK